MAVLGPGTDNHTGPESESGPTGLRVALALDHWAGGTTDPIVVTAVEQAARTLADLGHEVTVIGRPFDYDRLMSTWFPLFGGGVADTIETMAAVCGRPIDAEHLEPNTLATLARVADLGPDARHQAEQTATSVTAELASNLAPFDVMLTPTLDRVSIPLGRMAGDAPMDDYLADGDTWFDRLYVANVTGCPALSLPAPVADDDPPIGLQLMAPPDGEALLLTVADQLLGDEAILPVISPA